MERIPVGVRPEGHITIELRNAQGIERREFGNIVLNGGWESLLSRMLDSDGSMVPKWLFWGVGDSEPSADDPGLEHRLSGGKDHTSLAYGGVIDGGRLTAYSEVIVRFDYAPGELSGQRWTELGLAYGSGYTEPYNRALVLDESGVPTPLVVLPDQSATVYVRLRLHATGWGRKVATGDITGTLSMSPNIPSSTVGLWQKGFPLQAARLGSLDAIRETYAPPYAKFVFFSGVDFNENQIVFRSRDNVDMLQIDLDSPGVRNIVGLTMNFRIGITIVRGD